MKKKIISPELFTRIWEKASSLTEVSVILRKVGHGDFTPRKCHVYATVLRRFGLKLKIMPVSDLPKLQLDTVEEKVASSEPLVTASLYCQVAWHPNEELTSHAAHYLGKLMASKAHRRRVVVFLDSCSPLLCSAKRYEDQAADWDDIKG